MVKADLLCVSLAALEPAPAMNYADIFDASDPCHLGDEWNYEDVCGNGHWAALQAARVVADGVTEDQVLTWDNLSITERLLPLPVATHRDGTSLTFCVETNTFRDGTPAAWVVRSWPSLLPGSELLSDTLYAWVGEPPAFATALSADLLALGTTGGDLLLLKRRAEPGEVWLAHRERTRLPLGGPGVRVFDGGQAAGMFIVAAGARRFVVDLRGVVASMAANSH